MFHSLYSPKCEKPREYMSEHRLATRTKMWVLAPSTATGVRNREVRYDVIIHIQMLLMILLFLCKPGFSKGAILGIFGQKFVRGQWEEGAILICGGTYTRCSRMQIENKIKKKKQVLGGDCLFKLSQGGDLKKSWDSLV